MKALEQTILNRRRLKSNQSVFLKMGTILVLSLSFSIQSANAQPFQNAASSFTDYTLGRIQPQLNCAALANIDLPNIVSMSSKSVAASASVPAYCQVSGLLDPEIAFEVNLPANWNNRFYMVGNGGHAGQQPGSAGQVVLRNDALSQNFVMASTNTGHNSNEEPGATFVMSNPQKAIDYAYRAVHLTAVTAKEMAKHYYGQAVSYSYWNSCSNGGRQGMLEAQRYPDDFDGVVANAPWVDQTGFTIGAMWNHKALSTTPINASKVTLLADHVMEKCDAVDGLSDGIIDDPRQCDFVVARDVPSCPAGSDTNACLTSDQANAIQKIYDGPRTTSGEQIFPGFMLGSEALVAGPDGTKTSAWMNLLVPSTPNGGTADFGLAQGTMRYLAFQPPQPEYDYLDFDYDQDPELLDRWSRLADAKDTNLNEFRAKGGKLIMTYGWSDQILQPMMGVNYYEQAVAANSPNATDFMRLFMVPGMTHCAGGVGPDQNDAVSAVIDWVEQGIAPDLIVASKIENGETTRSRPLCPYPQVARYQGQGSIDAAENFRCVVPD